MHFIHFCVRVHQISQVPDSDVGWEDMYHEGGGLSWFDWCPCHFLLVLGSLLNTAYLFTRVKLYRLHLQADPVASPNARFVERDLDYERLEPSPMWKQVVSLLWRGFKISWCFLLGIAPPPESAAPTISLIQQLEVWTPGEFETTLFCVYSPAHCLMWMATNSSNWMMMFIVMGVVGVQIHTVSLSFRALLKDKEIIASQVMNEYNYKFVNPRVNPIRKDASVMTHQSEVVNVWED
ncbi:hypothetical protein DL96DRAFT_1703270 [Flagelloscypha sp. PMI_526]|nr:hypothetical protein DL96DRAFT_1703270 [Flagelloscypha sp. PMI_526]